MNKRFGFDRKIENVGTGKYRWTVSKDGKVIASNVESTKADATRVMRSTVKFLVR